jgi:hypothetical protein
MREVGNCEAKSRCGGILRAVEAGGSVPCDSEWASRGADAAVSGSAAAPWRAAGYGIRAVWGEVFRAIRAGRCRPRTAPISFLGLMRFAFGVVLYQGAMRLALRDGRRGGRRIS